MIQSYSLREVKRYINQNIRYHFNFNNLDEAEVLLYKYNITFMGHTSKIIFAAKYSIHTNNCAIYLLTSKWLRWLKSSTNSCKLRFTYYNLIGGIHMGDFDIDRTDIIGC